MSAIYAGEGHAQDWENQGLVHVKVGKPSQVIRWQFGHTKVRPWASEEHRAVKRGTPVMREMAAV